MKTEKIIGTRTIQIDDTVTTITCDLCGVRIPREKSCYTCKRHICEKCSVMDERDWNDDYPRMHCKECWEIGKEFRNQMNIAQNECDNKVEQLEKDWIHGALLNAKAKTININNTI